MHLVIWQRLCTPKAWGGLGLRSATQMNQASLRKAGWQLIGQREDMWAKVIRSKYKCGRDVVPNIQPSIPGSNFWQGICQAWKHVETNLTWRMESRKQVNCWNDSWITGGTKLVDYATRPLRHTEKFLRVCDIVNASGDWDLTRVDDIIPNELKDSILRMTPLTNRGKIDRVAWRCLKMCCSPIHLLIFIFLILPSSRIARSLRPFDFGVVHREEGYIFGRWLWEPS